MDSPLSRSPGSRVLMGVGLPITRASSPPGGPHRLEYWGTPPHRRSPPLALPPPPPLLHWPIEWDCAAPIRFWLVPGLACQLVVFAPSDWPCAKKRFTSSSPANSARMVVFPSTHLTEEKSGIDSSYNDNLTRSKERIAFIKVCSVCFVKMGQHKLNIDCNQMVLGGVFFRLDHAISPFRVLPWPHFVLLIMKSCI